MALKDWKKGKPIGKGIGYYPRKGQDWRNGIRIFYEDLNKRYGVTIVRNEEVTTSHFKTETEALHFAKSYMRSH